MKPSDDRTVTEPFTKAAEHPGALEAQLVELTPVTEQTGPVEADTPASRLH